MEMILKKIILQIFFLLGFLSASLFVSSQVRVIDNKGTISTIDASKWTRIGVTNDIYNKYPGNVGIGTTNPVATLHNAGSTLYGTLELSNFAANGAFGTAAATVDAYTSINIPQTTAGITLSIPAPTNPTAGRILKISNTGSTAFAVGAASINSAQTVEYVWNGIAWSLQTTGSGWSLTGNAGIIAGTNFLGTTTDVPMDIASNNTTMLQIGRRQTLGLYDNSSTGLFPYNQANNAVAYLVGGSNGFSALQFQADAASFYKPILFTDADGNFMMRGSAAGTDFFELGSAGTGNNGQLIFTIGDDGDEPVIFRKYNYTTQAYIEMMRLQGTGLNNDVRVGINTGGAAPTSTLQIDDVTATGAVQSINATGVYTGTGLWNLNANSATTGIVANISLNGLTSGTGLNITSNSASNTSTNGLLRVANTTATTTGTVFRAQSNSTAGTGLTVLASGNTGLGTSSPAATLHNAGSTLFGTLTLTNFAANGAIGTAAATVDAYTSINISQSSAGIALTIPAPTNTSAGRILQVSNTGTSPVTVGPTTIGIAQTAEFVYNGAAWTGSTSGVTTVGATTTAQANGASITGSTLNLSVADGTNPGLVSTIAQSISGNKTWNGLGTFNAGLTATGGAINLNASTAYATNIGNGTNNLILLGTTDINQTGSANTRIGNTTGTITLEGGTAATAIQIGNGASTHGIQIGTGAAVNTLVLGSTNSTSTTTIQGGSGTGSIAIDPATGGGIVIGDPAGTGEITLGNSSATQTVNVGNGAGASTVNIANGIVGNTVSIANGDNTTAQTVNIANGLSVNNSTVNILSGIGTAGASAINLGDNPRVTTINVGNYAPAAARTITVGGGASAVVDQINIGTGISTVAGGKTINIGTTAPNGGGTNIITIGASAIAAGNGVRFGTSRVVKNYQSTPAAGITVTLTAAQVLDAGIYVITGNSTVTFPTAALLVAAMPSPQVGDVITFTIVSKGNFTPTIAVGTGGTIGSQATGVARVSRYLSIRLTSITPAAYTIY